MALTLLEAAKQNSGDVLRSTIIETFARSTDILRALPFENILGNALKYNQEQTLPGIGFRGVNEGCSESVGVLNPVTEPLVIAGGDLDVDKFIIQTMGADQRSAQESMKVKNLAQTWANKFIKGNSAATPKEFDGLQLRLTGAQLIEAGATDGGDALSLAKLDQAIDAVDSPTHLIMSKAMRRRLSQAARSSTVGGYINYEQDEFGRRQTVYMDLPILVADENSNSAPALAFDEVGSGGAQATATSIYVVSLGSSMLSGIQNGDIMTTDLGELDTKPMFRTRVEWYAGIALFHPRAAARLRGIKDLAIVV